MMLISLPFLAPWSPSRPSALQTSEHVPLPPLFRVGWCPMAARTASQSRIGAQASEVVGNTPLVAVGQLGEGLGAEVGKERSALLRTYGAVVREPPSLGGMNESVELAREIVASTENAFMPQQFNNPANPEIHRRTTAEEIWRDLDGEVDAFVCGVGTGGTITGVGQVLKERRPGIQIVGVEPASSAVLSGKAPGPHKIQGIGPGFVPEVLDSEVIDEVMPIEDEVAIDTARLAATREGLLVGISAGAALSAALDLASRREMAGK